MAAPARVTQAALLVLGTGDPDLAQSPLVTEGVTQVACSGDPDLAQGPLLTEAVAEVLCSGDPTLGQSALLTQAAALVLCQGDPTLTRSPLVTESALLVAAPSPSPCNITESATNVACSGNPDFERSALLTQACLLVLCDADAIQLGSRVTESSLQLAHTGASPAPRLTQATLLVCAGPSCPDTREGIRSIGLRELTTYTLGLLGEDPASPDYWSRSEIESLVNEAQMSFVRQTKVLETVETFTTAVGQTEYELASTAMQVKRAFLDNSTLPPADRWEIDYGRKNWEGQDNQIRNYIHRKDKVIELDQSPHEAETLEVWTISLPTDMVSDCDSPGWPTWNHMALAFMAASTALGRTGEQGDYETSQAYSMIAQGYIDMTKRLVSNKARALH